MRQELIQRAKRSVQHLPILLLLCLTLPLFSSCEEDRWHVYDYLRGTWVSNDDPRSVFTLRFRGDGYGWVEERYDGYVEMYDEFVWEVDHNYIYVRYESDGMHETWAYDTDRRGNLYVDGINGEYEIRFVRWR